MMVAIVAAAATTAVCHHRSMVQRVVVDLSIELEVADSDGLVAAALARYGATKAANTPDDAAEEFSRLIRTNPGFAVGQFTMTAADAAGREFPGVRVVGCTGTQRVVDLPPGQRRAI